MPEADRRPYLGIAEDGKAEYNFHQSFLSDFVLCGERARIKLEDDAPTMPKPEADLGTALHDGIQYAIEEGTSYVEAWQVATDRWDGFDYDEKTTGKGEAYLANALSTFFDEVLDDLEPLGTEVPFRKLLLYEDARKRIYSSGTIDYVDANLGLVDWKSASRPYTPWEKQRWDGQASLYAWAWAQLHPDTFESSDGVSPFTFFVFVKPDGSLQRVTVLRDQGDYDWMALRCRNAVTLIEADLEHWPVNDQHALCSPKWCPAWDRCKGHFVSVDWPRKATAW